jgi:ribosome maturation protein SDO1
MSESMNLARIKRNGNDFEVVIHAELALKFKHNKDDQPDINDVLVFPQVYSDAKKGEVASPSDVKKAFGTEDPVEAAKEIIVKGDVALTSEYKKGLQEQKEKQILNIIQMNGVDPKTGLPHPLTRLENAMEQVKANIDPFEPAEIQAREILKHLRPILAIKFVVKEIELTIPAASAAKAYGIVKKLGQILRESWNNDGSWTGVIKVPGGMEQDLYDQLNKMAQGEVSAKVLRTTE